MRVIDTAGSWLTAILAAAEEEAWRETLALDVAFQTASGGRRPGDIVVASGPTPIYGLRAGECKARRPWCSTALVHQ